MKVLITGAGGFVARHVAAELISHGHTVATTDVVPMVALPEYRCADLCDLGQMEDVVAAARPDACIHLGGITFVPDGERNPGRIFAVNVGGTVNLMKALHEQAPKARVLFVSTAQVYGCTKCFEQTPVSESAPTCPLSMYMLSKIAAEQAVRAYGQEFGMEVMIARPANHTGPGQTTRFILPSLVSQAVRIKKGEQESFTAGNLESGRDFTDVRDVANAYRLIIECGRAGQTYNISAGQHLTIKELFDLVQRIVGTTAPVQVDASLLRPTDFSRILDTTRLRQDLQWSPRLTLDQTIRDLTGTMQ